MTMTEAARKYLEVECDCDVNDPRTFPVMNAAYEAWEASLPDISELILARLLVRGVVTEGQITEATDA